MQITPNQFWGTDYHKNPVLTDTMIGEAQKLLAISLPEEFIELLRFQNGGYTRGFVFPTEQETTWAEDNVPLEELFGIGSMNLQAGGINILHTAYMTAEWDLPPNQVILSGDGHWWITLDYRNGHPPSVAWLDVDNGQDIQLAASFKEFLARLLPADVVDEETGTLRQQ